MLGVRGLLPSLKFSSHLSSIYALMGHVGISIGDRPYFTVDRPSIRPTTSLSRSTAPFSLSTVPLFIVDRLILRQPSYFFVQPSLLHGQAPSYEYVSVPLKLKNSPTLPLCTTSFSLLMLYFFLLNRKSKEKQKLNLLSFPYLFPIIQPPLSLAPLSHFLTTFSIFAGLRLQAATFQLSISILFL